MVTMYQPPPSPLTMLDLMVKWVARTQGVKVTVHVEGTMGESTTVCDGRMPSLDGMPASTDERKLRRLLALRTGISNLYIDDGEAAGTEHGISIDFMRDSVANLDAKLLALNLARFKAAEDESP